MPRKKIAEPDDGRTPHQRNAIAAVEHLLGLNLGPNGGSPGLTKTLRDQVVDAVLEQAGLVLERQVHHLFHPKAVPDGATKAVPS